MNGLSRGMSSGWYYKVSVVEGIIPSELSKYMGKIGIRLLAQHGSP